MIWGKATKVCRETEKKTEKERDMERYGGKSNIGMKRDREINRERKKETSRFKGKMLRKNKERLTVSDRQKGLEKKVQREEKT
jgi:hypothetical protein